MEWEQDISMFDWFFTPNNTSSKVIAITIGTIKYCYNIHSATHQPTINSIKLFWLIDEIGLMKAEWGAGSEARLNFIQSITFAAQHNPPSNSFTFLLASAGERKVELNLLGLPPREARWCSVWWVWAGPLHLISSNCRSPPTSTHLHSLSFFQLHSFINCFFFRSLPFAEHCGCSRH